MNYKMQHQNISSLTQAIFTLYYVPELFVDINIQTYKKMGFKRFSILSIGKNTKSKKWNDTDSVSFVSKDMWYLVLIKENA